MAEQQETHATSKDKPSYPGLHNQQGEAIKLDAWPTDHDVKKHKALKKSDFNDPLVWMEQRAKAIEANLEVMRKGIAEFKRLGNVANRQKARKMLKLREQENALRDELLKDGSMTEEDLDALLKS